MHNQNFKINPNLKNKLFKTNNAYNNNKSFQDNSVILSTISYLTEYCKYAETYIALHEESYTKRLEKLNNSEHLTEEQYVHMLNILNDKYSMYLSTKKEYAEKHSKLLKMKSIHTIK